MKPEGPGWFGYKTLHDGTGTRLGAKAPGGSFALVSRNNSNVPEPGKTAASGAREDTRISQRKLAQDLPTAHPTRPAPSCLKREETAASRTAEPVRRRNCVDDDV